MSPIPLFDGSLFAPLGSTISGRMLSLCAQPQKKSKAPLIANMQSRTTTIHRPESRMVLALFRVFGALVSGRFHGKKQVFKSCRAQRPKPRPTKSAKQAKSKPKTNENQTRSPTEHALESTASSKLNLACNRRSFERSDEHVAQPRQHGKHARTAATHTQTFRPHG